MLKKALAVLALFTTLSSAAWDYLPILPKGLGQTAFQFEYTSMDPLSSIDLRAGIRFSPLNWLEISAILPYRIATSYDGDEPEIEAMVDEMDGIGNITFGVRFQFTETFSAYVDGYISADRGAAICRIECRCSVDKCWDLERGIRLKALEALEAAGIKL